MKFCIGQCSYSLHKCFLFRGNFRFPWHCCLHHTWLVRASLHAVYGVVCKSCNIRSSHDLTDLATGLQHCVYLKNSCRTVHIQKFYHKPKHASLIRLSQLHWGCLSFCLIVINTLAVVRSRNIHRVWQRPSVGGALWTTPPTSRYWGCSYKSHSPTIYEIQLCQLYLVGKCAAGSVYQLLDFYGCVCFVVFS